MLMVTAFPQPPALIRHALTTLAVIRSGDPKAIAELGDITELPRPWEPASCPPRLRQQLWLWCDDVAGWLNSEHSWRPINLIPACWPQHPHLAQELPVLACLRLQAQDANGPEHLEEWHRYALPLFFERLATRLGESTCRTGSHQDWPAASRYDSFTNPETVTGRLDLFHLDATPPTAP